MHNCDFVYLLIRVLQELIVDFNLALYQPLFLQFCIVTMVCRHRHVGDEWELILTVAQYSLLLNLLLYLLVLIHEFARRPMQRLFLLQRIRFQGLKGHFAGRLSDDQLAAFLLLLDRANITFNSADSTAEIFD